MFSRVKCSIMLIFMSHGTLNKVLDNISWSWHCMKMYHTGKNWQRISSMYLLIKYSRGEFHSIIEHLR